MKMTMPITAGLLVLFAGGTAWASCDQELATLDKTVQSQATEAIATSSGGEGVASKRDSEAIAKRDGGHPNMDPKAGPSGGGAKEAQVTNQAAKAGGAGDRVMQAKVSINEARVAKGKGDEAGCMAAVTKAKAQLKD